MSEADIHSRASSDEHNVAEQLVRARLEARALTQYPGSLPADFTAAYRCQDLAIARWPEHIGGWKVTIRSPEMLAQYGDEHLMGPAFPSNIRSATAGQVLDCPVFADGFSGVEPEIVIRVGRDAPPDKLDWTIEEAGEMVGELCIGVEVLSSPLPTLTKLGLPATVSDFGCNFGIVVGRPIPEWRAVNEIAAQCFIDDQLADRGVTSPAGKPLDSLAFALAKSARRGHPLKAGSVIATGTITRFHPIRIGQSARLAFEGIGEILCRAVQAAPRLQARTG